MAAVWGFGVCPHFLREFPWPRGHSTLWATCPDKGVNQHCSGHGDGSRQACDTAGPESLRGQIWKRRYFSPIESLRPSRTCQEETFPTHEESMQETVAAAARGPGRGGQMGGWTGERTGYIDMQRHRQNFDIISSAEFHSQTNLWELQLCESILCKFKLGFCHL